jgi:hypothetical protein
MLGFCKDTPQQLSVINIKMKDEGCTVLINSIPEKRPEYDTETTDANPAYWAG